MGYPGREHRQGRRLFFRKIRRSKSFFRVKKGGGDLFQANFPKTRPRYPVNFDRSLRVRAKRNPCFVHAGVTPKPLSLDCRPIVCSLLVLVRFQTKRNFDRPLYPLSTEQVFFIKVVLFTTHINGLRFTFHTSGPL